jgi:hypothetical protein
MHIDLQTSSNTRLGTAKLEKESRLPTLRLWESRKAAKAKRPVWLPLDDESHGSPVIPNNQLEITGVKLSKNLNSSSSTRLEAPCCACSLPWSWPAMLNRTLERHFWARLPTSLHSLHVDTLSTMGVFGVVPCGARCILLGQVLTRRHQIQLWHK